MNRGLHLSWQRAPVARILLAAHVALVVLGAATAHAQDASADAATQAPATPTDPRPAAGQTTTQDPQTSQDPRYDGLIRAALAAYGHGQWASALRDFQRAHQMLPTARTLRTIGMCPFNLGDYASAVVSLQEALAAQERPLSAEQAAQGAALIEQAMGEVTQLDVQISGQFATFLIDDHPPKRSRSGQLLVPPGVHVIRVDGPNVRAVQHGFTGNPGQRLSINITLEADEPARSTPVPTPQQAAAAAMDSGQPRGSSADATLDIVAVTALVAGGAALAAAGVTALLANGLRAELREDCPKGRCPMARADAVTRYDRYKAIATVTFYGGLGMAAAGGLLLALSPDESRPSAQLAVGPTTLVIKGHL